MKKLKDIKNKAKYGIGKKRNKEEADDKSDGGNSEEDKQED